MPKLVNRACLSVLTIINFMRKIVWIPSSLQSESVDKAKYGRKVSHVKVFSLIIIPFTPFPDLEIGERRKGELFEQ